MATQKEDKRADDIMLASIYYFEEETTVFYENQRTNVIPKEVLLF